MPYKSQAQRRKFHAMLSRGEIDAETVDEFDAASKGRKLPARVKAAYDDGVKLALATFSGPPRGATRGMSGPTSAPPKPPSLPKPPALPQGPAQHHTNDINTSMSSTDRRLNDRSVEPE